MDKQEDEVVKTAFSELARAIADIIRRQRREAREKKRARLDTSKEEQEANKGIEQG